MVSRQGWVGAAIAVVAVVAGALSLAPGRARAAASYQPAVSATVFDGAGELHVFWQGADGGISTAVQALQGGTWTGPATIPGSVGTVASAPTATVARQDGEIDVFWEGRDGGVQESVYNRAGWSPAPRELPGTAGTVASPVVAMTWRDDEEVNVYWRAADGTLDEVFERSTGAWSAVVHPGVAFPAGSAISSAITAGVFDRDQNVDLYWLGADGGIWEAFFANGVGWSKNAFEITPAAVSSSAPTIAEAARDTVSEVFFRGAAGQIEETNYTSGVKGWSAPATVPGTAGSALTSAPAATFDDESLTTHLLWEGAGGQILRTTYASGQGWLGSPLADVPMTAPQPIGHPVLTGTAPVTVIPRHRRGKVSVKVVARWKWFPSRTRLRSITLVKLPRQAAVSLSCTGRRCPAKRWSAKPGHAGKLRHRLDGSLFAAGDRLTLAIRMRHRRTERVSIRIRAGRKPLMTLR